MESRSWLRRETLTQRSIFWRRQGELSRHGPIIDAQHKDQGALVYGSGGDECGSLARSEDGKDSAWDQNTPSGLGLLGRNVNCVAPTANEDSMRCREMPVDAAASMREATPRSVGISLAIAANHWRTTASSAGSSTMATGPVWRFQQAATLTLVCAILSNDGDHW